MSPLLVALVLCGQAPTAEPAPIPDVRCGSHALYVALKAAGLAHDLSSFEELERTLGPPGAEGYSLGALAAEAERHGAYTAAVSTTLERLTLRKSSAEKFACIALLKPNHFVLLYEVDPNYAYFIDYPKEVRLPVDTLNLLWSTKCLLISSRPLRSEEALAQPWYSRASTRIWIGSVLVLGIGLAFAVYNKGVLAAMWIRHVRRNQSIIIFFLLAMSGAAAGCNGRTGEHLEPAGATRTAPLRGRWLEISPAVHELGTVNRHKQSGPIRTTTTIRNRGNKSPAVSRTRWSTPLFVSGSVYGVDLGNASRTTRWNGLGRNTRDQYESSRRESLIVPFSALVKDD
jgi:hypothetical protein